MTDRTRLRQPPAYDASSRKGPAALRPLAAMRTRKKSSFHSCTTTRRLRRELQRTRVSLGLLASELSAVLGHVEALDAFLLTKVLKQKVAGKSQRGKLGQGRAGSE